MMGFRRVNARRRVAGGLAAVAALAVAVSGCGGSPSGNPYQGSTGTASSSPTTSSSPSESPTPTPTPKPKPTYPTGPPMLLEGIAPLSNTTVGVAMPISIVFTSPVKLSARKQVERHLIVSTSTPVRGAWHWFGQQRVDFRPTKFWTPGTKVHLDAELNHVGDGFGRYGTHSYTRDFTIGRDVRTHVYVDQHKTTVTIGGKLVRTMPSNAGSPQFPSWDGTMAVVNKARTVRMTSCSVHIACDKNDPNFYDLVLPWDVRLTWSGTFLHYSTGDPYPGHGNGSHGCVHLSYKDAEWYYNLAKQGDPVTITGSPRGQVAGDNGYAAFNLSWKSWLAESGDGPVTTQSLTA